MLSSCLGCDTMHIPTDTGVLTKHVALCYSWHMFSSYVDHAEDC